MTTVTSVCIHVALAALTASLFIPMARTELEATVYFTALTFGFLPLFRIGADGMNLDVSRVARPEWKRQIVTGTVLSHILAGIVAGSVALGFTQGFLRLVGGSITDDWWFVAAIVACAIVSEASVRAILWVERNNGRGFMERIPVFMMFLTSTFALALFEVRMPFLP